MTLETEIKFSNISSCLIRDSTFSDMNMVCAEMIQQSLCYLSHFFDGLIKDCLIDLGRLSVSTDFSHELQGRGTDFLLRGGEFCTS